MTTGRGIETFEDGVRRASRALALRAGQLARSPGTRRLRALVVRHPGCAVIALGTVGWLLGLVGADGHPEAIMPAPAAAAARPVVRVAVPPEYVVLAGRLADEWRASRDGPVDAKGDAQGLAELRNAALDLGPLRPADPDIAAVVAEARAVFDEATASVERLLALPRPPGTLDVAAESFLRGLILDRSGIARQYDHLAATQGDILAEFRRLGAILGRGEAAKLMLPRLAARHGGPQRQGGPALAVDLDAAWGPVGPDDWLTLTNASGVDLHNATVLVQVRGEAGDVAPSVHFVPSWPAGTAIQARYTRGQEVLGFQLDRRTVPDVASVAASLWAEELSQQDIVCSYAGAERDADIARYCSAMSVRVHYRPLEPGLLWNRQRGLEQRLDGVATLPSPRITATFRRGGDHRAWHWDFPRWDRGEWKALEPGKALPWDPEEVAVEVSFPGTGYTHKTIWPAR